jgi:hypothetical protein
MTKGLGFLAFLLLAATAGMADDIVSVALNPADYGVQVSNIGQVFGDEIVAVTFTSNTTAEIISNVVIAATGPF